MTMVATIIIIAFVGCYLTKTLPLLLLCFHCHGNDSLPTSIVMVIIIIDYDNDDDSLPITLRQHS